MSMTGPGWKESMMGDKDKNEEHAKGSRIVPGTTHRTARLPLEQIRPSTDPRPRVKLSKPTVATYERAYRDDEKLPPILVRQCGEWYEILDGGHRYRAALRAGLTELPVQIVKVTDEEAFDVAVQANMAHGLAYSMADRKHIAAVRLQTPRYSGRSDREISRVCGLSPSTVGKLRKKLSSVQNGQLPSSTKRQVNRGGKVFTMETADIGSTAGKEGDHPPATAVSATDAEGSATEPEEDSAALDTSGQEDEPSAAGDDEVTTPSADDPDAEPEPISPEATRALYVFATASVLDDANWDQLSDMVDQLPESYGGAVVFEVTPSDGCFEALREAYGARIGK